MTSFVKVVSIFAIFENGTFLHSLGQTHTEIQNIVNDGYIGSKIADQRPARERPHTVRLRHTDTYVEGRSWVGSCR